MSIMLQEHQLCSDRLPLGPSGSGNEKAHELPHYEGSGIAPVADILVWWILQSGSQLGEDKGPSSRC